MSFQHGVHLCCFQQAITVCNDKVDDGRVAELPRLYNYQLGILLLFCLFKKCFKSDEIMALDIN